MKKIKVISYKNPGKFALVDNEDYNSLSKYKWYLSSSRDKIHYYAYRGCRTYKKTRTIFMHREIMKAPKGTKIDHKNRNNLDNRKNNLRFATQTENMCNRPQQNNNSSGYKGVFERRNKTCITYCARIGHNKKYTILGFFKTKLEAAVAYNIAAKKLHGEFAFQNEIKLNDYVRNTENKPIEAA